MPPITPIDNAIPIAAPKPNRVANFMNYVVPKPVSLVFDTIIQ